MYRAKTSADPTAPGANRRDLDPLAVGLANETLKPFPTGEFRMNTSIRTALAAIGIAALVPSALAAEQVGNVDVDWLGNDIVIESFDNPRCRASPAMLPISTGGAGPASKG